MARGLTLDDLPVARAVPALTAAQMAEVDRAALDEYGLSTEMLMENASRAVALAARAALGGSVAEKRIVALAGPGNNGGDALGAARHLLGWGALVSCILAAAPERLRPLARRQFDILQAISAAPSVAPPGDDAPVERTPLDAELARADLVLDGLLGYGASGAPRGEVARLIGVANDSHRPILAVDLPSGLDPDTGEVAGVAIRAVATITLALPKVGLLVAAASPYVGTLLVGDIAVPPVAYARFGVDASALFRDGELVRIAR